MNVEINESTQLAASTIAKHGSFPIDINPSAITCIRFTDDIQEVTDYSLYADATKFDWQSNYYIDGEVYCLRISMKYELYPWQYEMVIFKCKDD